MATSTTNLSLIKPDGTDKIRIAQINQNMDTIDAKIGAVSTTSLQAQNIAQDGAMAIVSTGNTHGAISAGQFVYVRNHSTLNEGLYTANSAIAANVTLSSSNLTAVIGGGLNALNSQITAIYHGTLPTNTDLNNIKSQGAYLLSSTNTYQNAPVGWGLLEFITSHNTANISFGIQRLTTDSAIFFRYFASGTWLAWSQINPIIVVQASGTTDANGNFVTTYSRTDYSVLNANVGGAICIPWVQANADGGKIVVKVCSLSTLAPIVNADVSVFLVLRRN